MREGTWLISSSWTRKECSFAFMLRLTTHISPDNTYIATVLVACRHIYSSMRTHIYSEDLSHSATVLSAEPVASRCSFRGLKARQLISPECPATLCPPPSIRHHTSAYISIRQHALHHINQPPLTRICMRASVLSPVLFFGGPWAGARGCGGEGSARRSRRSTHGSRAARQQEEDF